MGRIQGALVSDTWTLQRALELCEREFLSASEINTLIEGSRRCASHGIGLISSGRDGDHMIPVLDALAVTSGNLMEKASSQMAVRTQVDLLPEDACRLKNKMAEVQRDTQFLNHWIQTVNSGLIHDCYDA